MRTSHVKKVFAAVVFTGLAALGLMVGCSTDDNAPAAAKPAQACPASFALTNGAKCTTEGFNCDTTFNCGAFFQQAQCFCKSGVFVCTDATTKPGESIPVGSDPTCTPNPTPTETCPGSVSAADTTACKTSGKVCYYEAAVCADTPEAGTAARDLCQCAGNPATMGLSWRCEVKTCPSPDGGTDANDSGTDSGDPGDSGDAG